VAQLQNWPFEVNTAIQLKIQDAAEIVKHFKILLRASPLGYGGVQIFEHKQ
jgi:hypothetical protein